MATQQEYTGTNSKQQEVLLIARTLSSKSTHSACAPASKARRVGAGDRTRGMVLAAMHAAAGSAAEDCLGICS